MPIVGWLAMSGLLRGVMGSCVCPTRGIGRFQESKRKGARSGGLSVDLGQCLFHSILVTKAKATRTALTQGGGEFVPKELNSHMTKAMEIGRHESWWLFFKSIYNA